MGVYDFEQYRQRQQEIEVKALVALTKSKTRGYVIKAENRLLEIAFPEKVIDRINQELIYNGEVKEDLK